MQTNLKSNIKAITLILLCVAILLGFSSTTINAATQDTNQKTKKLKTTTQAQKPKEAQTANTPTNAPKNQTNKESIKESTKSNNKIPQAQNQNAQQAQEKAQQKAQKSELKKQEKAKKAQEKQKAKLAQKEAKKQAKIEAKIQKNSPPKNLLKRNLQKALSFSPFYVGILSFLDVDRLEKSRELNSKESCEGSEVDFTCTNPNEIEIFSPHIKLSNVSQHYKLFPNTLQIELSANISQEFFLDALSFNTPSQRGEIQKLIPNDYKDILTIKKEGSTISYDYRVNFTSENGTLLSITFDGKANNPLYQQKSLAEFLQDFMLSAVPKSIDFKELCQNLSKKECARMINRKKTQLSITLFSPKNLNITLTSPNFSDTMYAIYAIDVANKARVSDRQTYKKDLHAIIAQESLDLRKSLISDKMPINTHNFALDLLLAFGGFFLDSESLGFEVKLRDEAKSEANRLLLKDFMEDNGRLRDFLSSLRFSVIW